MKKSNQPGADADAEVHQVLLDSVFPRQAEVLTTDQWIRRLAARRVARPASPRSDPRGCRGRESAAWPVTTMTRP